MQFLIIGFLALTVAGSDHFHAIERSRRETNETTNSNEDPTSTLETPVADNVTDIVTNATVTTKKVTTTTIATAKVVTTEPATEAVTTKSSAATEPTQATSTTSTPAATSAALEYGCGKTHWDNDQEKIDSNQCRFLCNCEGDCDQSSGMCNVDDNQSCPKGYEGEKCQTPICAVDCGAEGVCVKEHQCVCTNLYTKVTEKIVHDVHGDIIVHRCTNLRVDGLKGALCALVVLIISISACACLHSVSQKRMKSYSYVDDSHM